MLDTMKQWIANRSKAETALDDFTSKLINALESDMDNLDALRDRHAADLISSGYGFLDEPSNDLSFSRDLWKGYALGFLRGQIEESIANDEQ